jgi:hypothetical protein
MAEEVQVFTGDGIEAFRLASIEGRLKLELAGIKFRLNTFAAVKRQFGFKGSRAKVLAQFQAHRRAWNEAHGFGTVTSDTAAQPRS